MKNCINQFIQDLLTGKALKGRDQFGILTFMLLVLLGSLRHCSSVSYVPNVAVSLLCLRAMDDPLCTHEAIPWDEYRANKNVVLATTLHGGHLAFFEGLTARNLWWVKAVDEFLGLFTPSL